MSFFKSSNPALKENTFTGTLMEGVYTGEEMTVKGVANKFGILLLLMFSTTLFSWNWFYSGRDTLPLLIGSIIGCIALNLIITFKSRTAPYLAPAYALLKGLFVGSVSAWYDAAYAQKYPGIVMQAVALTLAVALVMFFVYRYRIIKVTERFKSVIIIATISLAIFYLAQWISALVFHYEFGAFTNAATPLGIGFSIVVVCLAALFLLIDFDLIEKGVEARAPRYMEWYGAFALLVTMVWLYLEILRLLSKLRK